MLTTGGTYAWRWLCFLILLIDRRNSKNRRSKRRNVSRPLWRGRGLVGDCRSNTSSRRATESIALKLTKTHQLKSSSLFQAFSKSRLRLATYKSRRKPMSFLLKRRKRRPLTVGREGERCSDSFDRRISQKLGRHSSPRVSRRLVWNIASDSEKSFRTSRLFPGHLIRPVTGGLPPTFLAAV